MVVLDLVKGIFGLDDDANMVQNPVYFEEQGFVVDVGCENAQWGNFTACHVLKLVDGGGIGVVVVGGQPLKVVRVVSESVVFLARLPIKDAVAGRAEDLVASVDLPDGHEALGALAGGGHDLTGGEDIVGVTPVGPGGRLMGMTPVTELSMTGLANKEVVDITTAVVHRAGLDVRRLCGFFHGCGCGVLVVDLMK